MIIADTYANQPHRTRSTIDKYQAGTRKVPKKLGRGRGARKRGRGSLDVINATSTVTVCT